MSDFDALIVALADGQTMRDAALLAGMPSAVAIRGDVDERERQPQPAAEATAADPARPMAGYGLAAAVQPDELVPERSGVDALLIEDTTATLQLLERIAEPRALDGEQRARSAAVREVLDNVRDATVFDVLSIADYIVTGSARVALAGVTAAAGRSA